MLRSLLVLTLGISILSFNSIAYAKCKDMYDTQMRELHSSRMVDLCQLVDQKPALIINTASHCGFTPQFKALEALHQHYKAAGLVVIGFASDDFRQEAKDEAESATICYKNYGVSFTMLAPSKVRGEQANHVFQYINQQSEQPAWNFYKYIVDKEGNVVARFGSRTKPDSKKLHKAIKQVL